VATFAVRLGAALATSALLAGAAGCGGDPGGEEAFDTKVAVYVGVPLRGPWGERGQAIRDGAKLAIAQAGGGVGSFSVRLSFQDVTDPVDARRLSAQGAATVAGTALRDQGSVAMIGGLDPVSLREQLLLSAQTGLSFVSASGDRPTASEADLSPRGRRLFVDLAADQSAIAAQVGARVRGCSRIVQITAGLSSERRRALARALPARGVREVLLEGFRGRPAIDAVGRALRRAPDCLVLAAEPAAGDPVEVLEPVARRLRGTRIVATRGAASPTLAQLARRERLTAEAVVDEAAAGDDAEGRRIDALHRRWYGTPAPVGVQPGWRAVRLILRAVAAAGDRGNWRNAVAAQLVHARIPGPPAEGRQHPDGHVDPAPVGLARPEPYGWRVVRTLAR